MIMTYLKFWNYYLLAIITQQQLLSVETSMLEWASTQAILERIIKDDSFITGFNLMNSLTGTNGLHMVYLLHIVTLDIVL